MSTLHILSLYGCELLRNILIYSIALIDLSESDKDEFKRIDVYAIGFEEMVDLDAKNIMNARY